MFRDDGAVRFIEGPDNADAPIPEGKYEVDADVAVGKFKRFVREFAYNTPGTGGINIGTLKYRDQFQQNCSAGFYTLEVSLNDLNTHEDGEILAHVLQTSPTMLIPLCERALQELYYELVKQDDDGLPTKAPHIQLTFAVDTDLEGTFGTMKPKKMRELTSQEVEKLVVVQGIVVKTKSSRHKARKLILKCSSCENTKELTINAGFCAAHIPGVCDGNSSRGGQLDKCPPGPFVIMGDMCEYADEQVLRLQELPEDVPTGDMPRSFDLCVHQYLVDKCTPGSRLTAVGIFCATEFNVGERITGGKGRGTNTVKYSYVQVLGIDVGQGNSGQTAVSPEEEEKFEQLARDPEIREKIYKSIAPAIFGSSKDVIDEVKKAVACLLFGGSLKRLPDGTRMRGDINVLLLGDPGTAKSQFLKFANKAAPISVYTSGKGSSAAGLTAAIVQDKNNGFTLEGGAMVLADGGIVCIDEFDKMDSKDRVAIHEGMEQQTISIAKAGITTMLNTRCSVLAAANPRFGSYDDLTNTADQMDFETTILSRFDMMFLVKDVRDADRDFNICTHIVQLHAGITHEDREGPLSIADLRRFISYCRSRCAPRVTPDAAEVLKNHYINIRKKMKGERAIPITVRQLEAIIRISESLAKMELQEDVNVGHVEEALRLFTVSTLDSANRDRAGSSILPEERQAIEEAEEQIRRLLPRGGRKNKELLHSLLAKAGVDERVALRAINVMLKKGDLQEKAGNTVQRAQ